MDYKSSLFFGQECIITAGGGEQGLAVELIGRCGEQQPCAAEGSDTTAAGPAEYWLADNEKGRSYADRPFPEKYV